MGDGIQKGGTRPLLKNEAQHARDLSAHQDMSSEDLEYRAKLVELIYSSKRNLIEQFIHDADNADKSNGHSIAPSRIIENFSKALSKNPSELKTLEIENVQTVARILLRKTIKRLSRNTFSLLVKACCFIPSLIKKSWSCHRARNICLPEEATLAFFQLHIFPVYLALLCKFFT